MKQGYIDKCVFFYRKIGRIDVAIHFGQKSMRSAQKNCMKYDQNKESRIALADCYMNLGVVYDENKQYAEAVQYYQQGIEIFKGYCDEDLVARNSYINALLSRETTMFQLEQLDDSQICFQHIIDFLQNDKNDDRYIYVVKYINMIHQKKGERIQ